LQASSKLPHLSSSPSQVQNSVCGPGVRKAGISPHQDGSLLCGSIPVSSTGSACFAIPTKPLPRLGSRLPPSGAPSRESLSRLLQLRGKSRRVLGKFASARSSIGKFVRQHCIRPSSMKGPSMSQHSLDCSPLLQPLNQKGGNTLARFRHSQAPRSRRPQP